MGYVAIIATVVAAAAKAYQGYQAQQQAKRNEKVLKQEAQAARAKSQYDEGLHRDRVRQLLSRQRALYGAAGVQIQGSPLLGLEDTAAKGELDALAIRHRGETEYRRFRNRAELVRKEGDAAFKAGLVNAGSPLLSGYGKYKAAG